MFVRFSAQHEIRVIHSYTDWKSSAFILAPAELEHSGREKSLWVAGRGVQLLLVLKLLLRSTFTHEKWAYLHPDELCTRWDLWARACTFTSGCCLPTCFKIYWVHACSWESDFSDSCKIYYHFFSTVTILSSFCWKENLSCSYKQLAFRGQAKFNCNNTSYWFADGVEIQ